MTEPKKLFDDRLLTAAEIWAKLGISKSTFYELLKRGDLPAPTRSVRAAIGGVNLSLRSTCKASVELLRQVAIGFELHRSRGDRADFRFAGTDAVGLAERVGLGLPPSTAA